MRHAATLLDAVHRLESCPTEMGVHFLTATSTAEFLAYRTLHRRGLCVANHLRARGVTPGDAVVIALPSSLELLQVVTGAVMAGAVVVCVDPGLLLRDAAAHARRLLEIAARAAARLLVAQEPLAGWLRGAPPPSRCSLWDPQRDVPEPDTRLPPVAVRPSDIALIQFTSGSTGRPKGAMITHGNIVSNATNLEGRFRPSERDVMVSWLPLFHDMGLNAFFGGVWYPGPFVLIPTQLFVYRPESWLRAISRFRGTISPGPNFAYARCAELPEKRLAGLDLSSWRVASNGAERVRAETLEAFAGRFSSCGFGAHALYPVYGLAEATLAVTAPEVGTGYRVDPAPPTANGNGAGGGCVSVGHPFADHELRVVDGEGRSLPERCVGEIWVRGPSVCCGYVNDPEASARLLARGWLHTGDLGYLAQGDLHVVGRLGGKIVVRGKNYHAEEIEEVVERLPGVRPNGVLAFGVESDATESVVVAAEVRHAGVLHDAERLRRQMRELVARYCGLVPADVLVLGPNSIRRTSSGKKRRDDFREQYLAYRSLGGQIPRSPH